MDLRLDSPKKWRIRRKEKNIDSWLRKFVVFSMTFQNPLYAFKVNVINMTQM